MKKFEFHSRMNLLDIIIAIMCYTILCTGFYYYVYFLLGYITKQMSISLIIVALAIFAIIFIFELKSIFNKDIYFSALIIDEDTIQLVYKKGKKIFNIEQIAKKDISLFNIIYQSCLTKTDIKITIQKKDSTVITLENQLILNSPLDGRSIQYFLVFLLKNKNEFPNFNFEYSVETKWEKEYFEHLHSTGKEKILKPSFKILKQILNQKY